MNLEDSVTEIHNAAFWKEFTFRQTQFAPKPGHELELADNLIWLGNHATILQLKERRNETTDPETERAWFTSKVLKKATKQVRDTLKFLDDNEQIQVTNERGHSFNIKGKELVDIVKLVVFQPGNLFPDDCASIRFHISTTAGFIHIISVHEYNQILTTLGVPDDIREYFQYRERALRSLPKGSCPFTELDVLGAFLNDDESPDSKSANALSTFCQDSTSWNLSGLLADLHNHIERSDKPFDYYRILLHFSRLPRSVWREIKTRLTISLEAAEEGRFEIPFRLAFPATDCSFMIAPIDPQVFTSGVNVEQARTKGLKSLTYAAKYDTKMTNGIGVLVSKPDEYVHIDWCLIEWPHEPDTEVETLLRESYPFRPAQQKLVNSFLFRDQSKTNQ